MGTEILEAANSTRGVVSEGGSNSTVCKNRCFGYNGDPSEKPIRLRRRRLLILYDRFYSSLAIFLVFLFIVKLGCLPVSQSPSLVLPPATEHRCGFEIFFICLSPHRHTPEPCAMPDLFRLRCHRPPVPVRLGMVRFNPDAKPVAGGEVSHRPAVPLLGRLPHPRHSLRMILLHPRVG